MRLAAVSGESPLPKSVLVVDDEQLVLDILKIALTKGGFPVTCAHSAEEAFEALGKEQFGAVLTDKNLPGKNGLEVIKEARRLYPYCACLVMTGYANTESVVESMRLGANDYLEKPFPELGLVLQRLKVALEHQTVMFERAALAEGLRYMDQTLKRREKEVFAHRTELEMLQHVVEMRIEDATRDLTQEHSELRTRLDALRAAALECVAASRSAGLTPKSAKELLAALEKLRASAQSR